MQSAAYLRIRELFASKRKVLVILPLVALALYGITLIPRSMRRAASLGGQAFENRREDEGLQERWRMSAAEQKADVIQKRSVEKARKAAPGLAQSQSGAQKEVVPADQGRMVGYQIPPLPSIPDASRRLVFSGQLSIEVKNFTTAFNAVQEIVAEGGGYLSDIQVRRQNKEQIQGTLTLRVPPGHYFQTLNRLRPLGTLMQEGSGTRDVTRQWLNLNARIASKREMESRMWGTVRSRSQDIYSLTDAEYQLDWVNEGLERLCSEQDKLQQDVLLSTITLELREPPVEVKPVTPSPWAPLGTYLKEAGAQMVRDIARLIYWGLVCLPWGLAAWLVWRGFRRFGLPKSGSCD